MADIPNPTLDVTLWDAPGTNSVEVVQTFSTTGSEYGAVVKNIPRKVNQILTTTPLAGNATYTSAWFDSNMTGGIFIRAVVFTNQASATNGLILEETSDTTDSNMTKVLQTISVPASTLTTNLSQTRGRYWRVRYINGASAQASFKLAVTEMDNPVYLTDNSGKLLVGTYEFVDTTQPPMPEQMAYYVNAGKTFGWAGSVNQASKTTENPMILLVNPNGSGKTAYIHHANFGVNAISALADGIKFYGNPTVTANGTAQTIVQSLIGSGVTSAMNLFTIPTTTANGVLLRDRVVASGSNSEYSVDFDIVLPPNNKLLITGLPSTANTLLDLDFVWVEV